MARQPMGYQMVANPLDKDGAGAGTHLTTVMPVTILLKAGPRVVRETVACK